MLPLITAIQLEVLPSAFVLGVAAAGLYGFLALPLVLTYQVSRTIGFVQGGIALFGMFFYWWLSGGNAISEARIGRAPAAVLVVLSGVILGAAYGWMVTGKLANWPRLRLTTFSLGWLLGLNTVIVVWFLSPKSGFIAGLGITLHLPSLFGDARYQLADVYVTRHQVITVGALAVLTILLTVALSRTRTGTFVRAIADDPEAGRWVGIPLNRVGTAVYGLSGALSAFAGVLMTHTIGLDAFVGLVVFLRALTVSVFGGFRSVPLALTGCVILGVAETTLITDGSLTLAQREITLTTVLFALVFLINRLRPLGLLEASS